MALKRKINKDDFEKLSAEIKAEYNANGDHYLLDVDGDDEIGPLRRAKEREAQRAKDLETKLKKAEADLESLSGDDSRKRGDIETLEKKWSADLDAEKKGRGEDVAKYKGIIAKNLIDTEATKLATAVSKAPALLARVIRDRITVDFDDTDTPQIKVLDAKGVASASTLEDLRKEVVANPEFKDIIIVSKASGGAGKPGNMSSGADMTNNDKPADLARMNPAQLAAHIKAKKAEQSATE